MHSTISCARCGAALDPTAAFCSACGLPRSTSRTISGTRRATRADPVLDALRATTVGEFDIGGRLGTGGMASVYLAHELRLNRRVAIKAMLPELLDKEDMIERFFDEARKQARLEHPNIVPIYALVWEAEVPFFVMKFVDGFTVDDIIHARGALPIPVVQHILNGTISALQYAHDEGVIHRDVKPGNVLIDRRGQPVVSDFGIAKAAESPNLTQTGATIGTPTYMSPEQCRGLPVMPASDQYSVGVLAFHLLVGSTPFNGSMLDLLQAHAEDPPPQVLERRPDCPPRLAAAVMRMLAKSPDDRWPELRDALPDIVAGMGSDIDARRQLIALFPDRPTAAESLPLTPKSPTPASSKSRKRSAPAISLVVAPSTGNWELGIGESVQMTVRRSGDTGAGQSTMHVVWQTSDDAVATVTVDGLVTAHGSGPVSIIATDGPLTGRCDLTVVPVGETPRVETALVDTPIPTSTGERATEIVPTQQRDSAASVTAVAPAKPASWRRGAIAVGVLGLAAAIAFYGPWNRAESPASAPVADSATTPAEDTTAGAVQASVAATTPAAAPTAARVSLLLTRAELTVGDSARATVRAFDSAGTRVTGVPISLSSSAPEVVKVGSDGIVVALAAGTATIHARSGSATTSQTVTVAERLLPLSANEALDALRPLLALASDERWDDLQSVLQPNVLESLKGKRRIDASLAGDLRITSSAHLDSATVDFDITMRWLNFARMGRSGQAPLRATFVRTGKTWRVTDIAARGPLP